MEELIIAALIQHGGIFGILLAIALVWIYYREKQFSKNNNSEDKMDEAREIAEQINEIQKEKEILQKFNKDFSEKIDDTRTIGNKILKKTTETLSYVEDFDKQNEENSQRLDRLLEDLKEVNQQRVEELKEVLSNYNRTMNELALTLEKIKFVLRTRIDEE